MKQTVFGIIGGGLLGFLAFAIGEILLMEPSLELNPQPKTGDAIHAIARFAVPLAGMIWGGFRGRSRDRTSSQDERTEA